MSVESLSPLKHDSILPPCIQADTNQTTMSSTTYLSGEFTTDALSKEALEGFLSCRNTHFRSLNPNHVNECSVRSLRIYCHFFPISPYFARTGAGRAA